MTPLVRIGKCGACKQVSRKDYTEIRLSQIGHGIYGRKIPIYGRAIANNGFVPARFDFGCPRCNAPSWNSKKIEGLVTGTRCDARCEGAKGHMCECACGGENHGKGFIVCDVVTAT